LKRGATVVLPAICIALTTCATDLANAQAADHPLVATERITGALQATPYMWAAGLKGDLSPFRHGPTLRVEKSFSDIMDDLNFGGFVNLWARHGRFVFSGDVMYVDTSDSHGTGPLGAFQIPGLGVTIPPGAKVDADVDSQQFMATLQGGYRLLSTPTFTVDALAGARFWHISNDVTVTASIPGIGSRSASHGESFSWVDPVIGFRTFIPLSEKLSFQAQADIGGFGVGADFTWSALATVNYIYNDRLSASLGYKVLDVDYERGGHIYDVQLSGPVAGVTYRF